MKKVVPDPPKNQARRRLNAILEFANKSLLLALKDSASEQHFLKTLKETGTSTFGCCDGLKRPLFAVREGVKAPSVA